MRGIESWTRRVEVYKVWWCIRTRYGYKLGRKRTERDRWNAVLSRME